MIYLSVDIYISIGISHIPMDGYIDISKVNIDIDGYYRHICDIPISDIEVFVNTYIGMIPTYLCISDITTVNIDIYRSIVYP
jgi:hypothetical protein